MVEVPRLQDITVKRVLGDSHKNEQVCAYLPDIADNTDPKSVDRSFLYNIVNTLLPDYFFKLIKEVEDAKAQKARESVTHMVQIKPELLNLLKEYGPRMTYSRSKQSGRALSNLKVGSKKRLVNFQHECPPRSAASARDDTNLRKAEPFLEQIN